MSAEDALQRELLFTEIGAKGSGAARYGAAMHFWRRGRLSAEMLEIYRRCCKLDHEDPQDLARAEGVGGFPLENK